MRHTCWSKPYSACVAIGTALWWALLLTLPQIKALFLWPTLPDTVLYAFLPADIVFMVLVPLAWFSRPSGPLWNVHRVGTHYATAVTVTLCLLTKGAGLGAALMIVASIGAEIVAQPIHWPNKVTESGTSSVSANILKTLTQIIVMWGVFLLLLPIALGRIGLSLALPALPWVSPWICLAVFVAAGSTGICSAMMFAVHGKGTPLPLDATTRFVVMGPYRFIRNPMAACGILQGVCVGAAMQSIVVVLYSLADCVVWHIYARPWEEADLEARFGEDYTRYKAAVHNWVPRVKPYQRVVLAKVGVSSQEL